MASCGMQGVPARIAIDLAFEVALRKESCEVVPKSGSTGTLATACHVTTCMARTCLVALTGFPVEAGRESCFKPTR